MAELALGVLGVAGLFSATLDVWSFVDAGQDYALSFTRLRTRLDLQRTLFVNWGNVVGFGSEAGYHSKLDDPDTLPVVRQVLTEIYLILSETDRLASKYGVRMLEEGEDRRPVAIPRRILSLGRSASVFRPRYEEFRLRFSRHARESENSTTHPVRGVELAAAQHMAVIRERQRNSSVWAKARWAIRDEGKMEGLVRDLAELVSGLRALTTDIVDEEREQQIAEQTVSDIYSVDSLRQVQEASPDVSPLSVSVCERIRSLESGASGTTAFYSARSRLSGRAVDDSLYGTSQAPQSSWFPETGLSQLIDGRTLESPSSRYPQLRTSTPESSEAPDAFAVDEYPPPELAVYNLASIISTIRKLYDASPDSHPLAVDQYHEPFITVLVSGPADTPYSGGQFRVQTWLGIDERAEIDGDEVTVCYIYMRFLTRICHPLVDADGYVHARFFVTAAAKMQLYMGNMHQSADMIHRMLGYYHWTGIDAVVDGEADGKEHLVSKAHSWTNEYAKPMFSQGSRTSQGGPVSNIAVSYYHELPPVIYPSRMKLERSVWEAQGVDGMPITLLGYPAVQTWEGQLMPDVRLYGKL